MIRQAVLLCAGLGTRLRPFTDTAPKPMLPILGIPMIEWNIRRLVQFGVRSILINLHYLPEVLTSYLGDGSQLGAQIRYSFEPEILGTAGGIKGFEEHLDDEFFVVYGDVFSRIDYSMMEDRWRKYGHGVGMQTVRRTDSYADADVVEVDEAGRVLAVHGKPHASSYTNACRMAGVFILRRDILSGVTRGVYSEIGKNLLPSVLKQNQVFWAYFCEDYSKGIDTIEKKREVEAYLVNNEITASASLPTTRSRRY